MKKAKKASSIFLVLVFLFFSLPLSTTAAEISTSETGAFSASESQLTEQELILPELIREKAKAEFDHVARLTAHEVGLDSYLFENSDGTRTMYTFNGNVKYIDSDGVIKNKSNVLTSNIDHAQRKTNYAYVNSQNDVKTYFPKKLSSETGLVLQYKERSLSLHIPQTSIEVNTVEKFSANNFVTYANAFGKGSLLQLTPTFDGVDEQILLATKPTTSVFSFVVETDGFSLQMRNGMIYLYELNGFEKQDATKTNEKDPVGHFSNLRVYDALGQISEESTYALKQLSETSWQIDIGYRRSIFGFCKHRLSDIG